jgi:hypothetical protein
VIQEYFTFCEYIIQQSPLVISYTMHIVMGSPSMGHIQGIITFVDGSELTFFELLSQDQAVVRLVKYRFHYQRGNQFIFRYDNAPHHQELSTFLKPQTHLKAWSQLLLRHSSMYFKRL